MQHFSKLFASLLMTQNLYARAGTGEFHRPKTTNRDTEHQLFEWTGSLKFSFFLRPCLHRNFRLLLEPRLRADHQTRRKTRQNFPNKSNGTRFLLERLVCTWVKWICFSKTSSRPSWIFNACKVQSTTSAVHQHQRSLSLFLSTEKSTCFASGIWNPIRGNKLIHNLIPSKLSKVTQRLRSSKRSSLRLPLGQSFR